MHHPSRLAALVSALGMITLTVQGTASAAPSLIAGVCVIELEVVRTADELDFTTPTDALCVTSDGLADGQIIGGGLRVTGPGCVAGVTDGAADFDLHFPSGTLRWDNTDLTVVYAGPVIDITILELGTEHIIGNGQFVQIPPADDDCETAAGATFTWSGVFTFEDPVLE